MSRILHFKLKASFDNAIVRNITELLIFCMLTQSGQFKKYNAFAEDLKQDSLEKEVMLVNSVSNTVQEIVPEVNETNE